MDYKDVLTTYSDYFIRSDVIINGLRAIGWLITCLLAKLSEWAEALWDEVFGLLDFAGQIQAVLGDYYPLFQSVLLVTLLASGTMFLLSEKRPPILKNMLVMAAVVIVLPGITDAAIDLLRIEKAAFAGNNMTSETVASNIVDLLYLYDNGWTGETPNALTGQTLLFVDINETVAKKTDKAFKYYMTLGSGGDVIYEEIKKSFFGLINPLYYRYYVDFFSVLLTLGINIFVFFCASYRLFRIIWEAIYGGVLAYIFSGDMVSGQKTKQLLLHLLNSFVAISIMVWGFSLWKTFQLWSLDAVDNKVVRLVMILFAGMAMIDGPDLVERVFGIDAGARDGFLKMMAAMRMMQNLRMHHMPKKSEGSRPAEDAHGKNGGGQPADRKEPSNLGYDSRQRQTDCSEPPGQTEGRSPRPEPEPFGRRTGQGGQQAAPVQDPKGSGRRKENSQKNNGDAGTVGQNLAGRTGKGSRDVKEPTGGSNPESSGNVVKPESGSSGAASVRKDGHSAAGRNEKGSRDVKEPTGRGNPESSGNVVKPEPGSSGAASVRKDGHSAAGRNEKGSRDMKEPTGRGNPERSNPESSGNVVKPEPGSSGAASVRKDGHSAAGRNEKGSRDVKEPTRRGNPYGIQRDWQPQPEPDVENSVPNRKESEDGI